MKKANALISLLMAAAMMLSLAACGGQTGSQSPSNSSNAGSSDGGGGGETYVWRIAHNNAEDSSWQLRLLELVDLVKEKSGGRLSVELYPNSQLGDDTAMCEMIRNNNLDMMLTGGEVPGRWYAPVNLMAMPYLFTDLDHLERCIYGEPGQLMADGLSEAGLGVFDYWLRANRQILSVNPIASIDDMKGLKIRVPETDIWIKSMTALGANPTPVAFSETFTALQQGVVNAVENPLSAMYTMRFHEVCPNLALTNHTVSCTTILYSESNFQKLPEDLQTILRESMDTVRQTNNELIRGEDEVYIEKMQEEVPNLTITEPDYESFATLGRAAHEDLVASVDGQELYASIQALKD